MWAQQQISCYDVDYNIWEKRRSSLVKMAQISPDCVFTVDVYKNRYDYASNNFIDLFGYPGSQIKNIRQNGDILENRIHPIDREDMLNIRIKHGQFIYSQPEENRNNFRNIFQFRMLNAKRQYINVISNQQVIQKDKNDKAWIIIGSMQIAADQRPLENVKYTCVNNKTGEIVTSFILSDTEIILTNREKEILEYINRGHLSKEIASKLNLSIHTINNHRKNILIKLKVDNAIEAINYAKIKGLLD